MRTELLCVSVLKVASGARMKLANCKSALNPRWLILLTVPSVTYSLLLCDVFYKAISFKYCLVLFYSCVFQSFEHCVHLARGRES